MPAVQPSLQRMGGCCWCCPCQARRPPRPARGAADRAPGRHLQSCHQSPGEPYSRQQLHHSKRCNTPVSSESLRSDSELDSCPSNRSQSNLAEGAIATLGAGDSERRPRCCGHPPPYPGKGAGLPKGGAEFGGVAWWLQLLGGVDAAREESCRRGTDAPSANGLPDRRRSCTPFGGVAVVAPLEGVAVIGGQGCGEPKGLDDADGGGVVCGSCASWGDEAECTTDPEALHGSPCDY